MNHGRREFGKTSPVAYQYFPEFLARNDSVIVSNQDRAKRNALSYESGNQRRMPLSIRSSPTPFTRYGHLHTFYAGPIDAIAL